MLSPWAWPGSCGGEGLSLPNLLKVAKCALLMEKETSGDSEQDLFSFERTTRAAVQVRKPLQRRGKREGPNLQRCCLHRGTAGEKPGEVPGKGNYRKSNAGLLGALEQTVLHHLGQGWEMLPSQLHSQSLQLLEEPGMSQALGDSVATKCKPAALPPPRLAAVQALCNRRLDREEKVKGDISAGFSWHLNFLYCSWITRNPEGVYLLSGV